MKIIIALLLVFTSSAAMAEEPKEAEAQYNLGVQYLKGEGVEQDDKAAANWLGKAANQGHASAQYSLGLLYKHGLGVEQDDKAAANWLGKAIKLFRKLAAQGDADAQYYLGLSYQYGNGVEPDYKEALKWYRRVAARGHEQAKKNLKELESVRVDLFLDILKLLFSWYIIFVVIAFIIASIRKVKMGAGFVITTLLLPMIGFFWAIFGKKKYIHWDKKEIKAAGYVDLKNALPHISSDLKEFAQEELAKKRVAVFGE